MSPFASGVLASVILATVAGSAFLLAALCGFVNDDHEFDVPVGIAVIAFALFSALAEAVLLCDIFLTFGWPR